MKYTLLHTFHCKPFLFDRCQFDNVDNSHCCLGDNKMDGQASSMRLCRHTFEHIQYQTEFFFLRREHMTLIVRATGVTATVHELGSICTTMTAPTSRYYDCGIKGLMLWFAKWKTLIGIHVALETAVEVPRVSPLAVGSYQIRIHKVTLRYEFACWWWWSRLCRADCPLAIKYLATRHWEGTETGTGRWFVVAVVVVGCGLLLMMML